MKICVLAIFLSATFVSGDHGGGGGHHGGESSYAVLPYGGDVGGGGHHGGGYEAPSAGYGAPEYVSYEYDDDDYGHEMKKFLKKPFKAMKGAGDYMMDSFKKGGSKFLELGGSIFRAKGELFKGMGENLLRHAYGMAKGKGKGKGKGYDSYEEPNYYYHSPPVSYGSPVAYGPPPAVYKAPHDNGYEGHDSGYEQGHDIGHDVGHDVGHGIGHGQDVGHELSSYSDFSGNYFEGNGIHKRESIKERTARSNVAHGDDSQLRRDYAAAPLYPVVHKQRPIPVPVPFYVEPSRLIFPSFPLQKKYVQQSGYH